MRPKARGAGNGPWAVEIAGVCRDRDVFSSGDSKMETRRLVVSALFFLFILSCTQPATPDPAAARREVEAVLATWTQGLETLDANLLSGLFSLDDQVVNWGVGVGERYLGWGSYETHVAETGRALSENHVIVTEQQVGLSKSLDAAWFSQVRDYRGVLASGGGVALQGVRVTGTMEKRDGTWRIVAFHDSLGFQPPAMDPAGE